MQVGCLVLRDSMFFATLLGCRSVVRIKVLMAIWTFTLDRFQVNSDCCAFELS